MELTLDKIKKMRVGNTLTYHVGEFCPPKQRITYKTVKNPDGTVTRQKVVSPIINAASVAWQAYEMGLCHLFQKRLSYSRTEYGLKSAFEYILVRRDAR